MNLPTCQQKVTYWKEGATAPVGGLGQGVRCVLWVPAIPGINYPGDDQRDFGQDPLVWLRKWKSILEGQVDGVIRSGYRMPKEPILEG